MHRFVIMLALPLVGCSETGITGEGFPEAPSQNPVPLENPIQTDTIMQVSPPVVDVAWVIDNSCSMSCIVSCHSGTITDNVTKNFPVFMSHFDESGIDYHIGVITTDLDHPGHDGKLQSGLGHLWIDPTVNNDVLAFTAMATQGTSGAGTEQGLGSVYKSHEVHGDTHNTGFYRDGSSLHTIVLSNELDQTPATLIAVDEFVDWYGTIRTPDRRTFNSLVCVNGRSEACPEQSGRDYVRVTEMIGGISWDIENEDWTSLLDSLGAQAAGLTSEYFLTQVPVLDTLVVGVKDGETGNYQEFEPTEFGAGTTTPGYVYTLERNSILFLNYQPTAGSTIELIYEPASSQLGGQ